MAEDRTPRFTLQGLMLVLLFNGAMLVAFFLMAKEALRGTYTLMGPLLVQAAGTAEPVRMGLAELREFFREQERLMPFFLFGLGGFFTLLLWISVQVMCRNLARTVLAFSGYAQGIEAGGKAGKQPAAGREEQARAPRRQEPAYSPEAAIQILSLLQRQGRLIDFLQEDLGGYEDAQIGAAVRSIHEGCRQVMAEHVQLKPVYEQAEEGSEVTVKAGFDPGAIRLTGNVVGNPPFRGVLRHRGWKVARVDLPEPVSGEQRPGWILAPAEVELEG